MKNNPILRIITKVLIPPILILALYIQFHGDFGPGGGFQAGAIFATGIILYSMVFGMEKGRRIIPHKVLMWLSSGGLFLFTLVGVITMLLGGAFLEYNSLPFDHKTAQVVGIVTVEFGVGLTVTAVVLLVFFGFADFRKKLP